MTQSVVAPSTYAQALQALWKQSWPLLLAQGFNIASNMLFGHLFSRAKGEYSRAAYGPSMAFYSLLSILNFTAMPLNIFIMDAVRRSQHQEVGVLFRSAILMSTILAALLSVPFSFVGNAFDAIGNPIGVGAAVNDFFRGIVYTAGLPPILAQNVLRRLLIGLKKPKVSMAMTLVYAVLSAVTAVLASHYDSTPYGFGLASSAAAWLTVLAMAIYLACQKADFLSYELFSCRAHPSQKSCLQIAKKGLYISAIPTVECILFAVFSGLIGREGKTALEAFSAANQYARAIILGAFTSIAAPLGTLMTSHKKAGPSPLKHCYHAGIILGAALALPVLLGALSIPQYLIEPFAGKPAHPQIFNQLLLVMAIGGLIDGALRIPSSGAIRPFNRDARSLVINVSGFSIGFGLILLSHFTGLGPIAMTAALYIGVAIAAVLQSRDVYQAIAATGEEARPLLPTTALTGLGGSDLAEAALEGKHTCQIV